MRFLLSYFHGVYFVYWESARKDKELLNTENEHKDELNALIRGCVENDRSCQERLYKMFYSKMLSMVRRYISHSEQAEEVLQNGFLRAFKKVDTFAFQGSFEGWLRRIVFNAISDYVKQNTQYREKVVLAEKEQSISETAAGRLQYKELIKLVQGLPESTRNVFNMFVIEGFSHKEIANQLNISEGTSKWHVSEGRRLLKEKIEKLY